MTAGQIFITGVATRALMDSGATHSFIANTFVDKLGIRPEEMTATYSVTVPSGEVMTTTGLVRALELELQGHTVKADIIVLSMPEFDIILGMDWLTTNQVIIDFR